MVRKVLIPVDGSDNSERAFHFYLHELRKPDDHLLLVHVQPAPHLANVSLHHPMSVPEEEWTKQILEVVKKSQDIIQHYEILCEQNHIKKEPLCNTGKPGEVIIEYAKSHNADIIVMGNRGLNAVRRTFLGSVSDFVLHHSHIPVMVVPPPS